MYWNTPYYEYRPAFQPIWATSFPQALDMIRESVQDEHKDEQFYAELIRLAPTQDQKRIISAIRDDERGHARMLTAMYRDLTGREIPASPAAPALKLPSYAEGLVTALFGELGAVERYRKIWSGLPEGVYKDTLLGIIMDEQKHAAKYNYLITLNRTPSGA